MNPQTSLLQRLSSLRVALLAALVAVASGCLKIDDTLTINKDGSGSLHMVYAMPQSSIAQLESMKTLMGQMQMASGQAASSNEVRSMFVFDEAGIRKQLAPFAARGVAIERLQIQDRQDWQYVDLQLQFKSLDALFDTVYFQDFDVSLSKNKDGNYVLLVRTPEDKSTPKVKVGDPETQKALSPVLTGLRMVARVVPPARIVETNAARKTDLSATWEIDYDREPRSVEQLQDLRIYLMFDGQGLTLPDFKRAAAK